MIDSTVSGRQWAPAERWLLLYPVERRQLQWASASSIFSQHICLMMASTFVMSMSTHMSLRRHRFSTTATTFQECRRTALQLCCSPLGYVLSTSTWSPPGDACLANHRLGLTLSSFSPLWHCQFASPSDCQFVFSSALQERYTKNTGGNL